MKGVRSVIALLSAFCVTASLGHAQLPRALTYQGTLTQADGAPMTGSVQMAFALYASANAATPLWSAPSANVSVTSGIYTVTLGETPFVGAPALSALPFDAPYFLAVTVNGVALTPRHQLTSAPYAFRAASVEGISMDAQGHVGIGGMPTATDALYVAGPIKGSSIWLHTQQAGGKYSQLGRLSSGNEEPPYINWWHSRAGGTPVRYGAIQGGDFGDSARFQFITYNGANFAFTGGGKVGIGTTAPQATLDVAGPITVSSSSAPLFFTGTTASGAPVYDGVRLRYDHNFFASAQDALVLEKTDGNENAPDGGIAVVMTGADQQADLAVAIRGDGKVGIGTPTPAYTLDVNGTIRGATVMPSDARLKTDIAPIADALAKVTRLRGVTFRWKDAARGGGTQIGLIAQDVAPVFPELVSTDRDGEQSIAYAQMVAPLIEAVKTLKADNDALKAELAEMRRRVETLETRVNALPR